MSGVTADISQLTQSYISHAAAPTPPHQCSMSRKAGGSLQCAEVVYYKCMKTTSRGVEKMVFAVIAQLG